MSKSEYTVISAGHTHAGKELAVGDAVSLPAATAARFPAVFKAIRSTSPSAERVTRSSKSASTRKSIETSEE